MGALNISIKAHVHPGFYQAGPNMRARYRQMYKSFRLKGQSINDARFLTNNFIDIFYYPHFND